MPDWIVQTDSEKFENEVLKSKLPVAVNFISDDCPPCEAVIPIFRRLAQQYHEHVKFVQVFRQQNRELADNLGIKSSPTMLFYKNGQEVCRRLTGYIKRNEIRQAIDDTIEGSCTKPERQRFDCDALVLGAGPAGLTTAIYLARAKLKTIVIDEGLPGGQVATTFHISNYPGTSGTVVGKDLIRNMVDQAMDFGAEIHDLKEVLEIDLRSDTKYIKTEDADYYARCVILCTGAEPRRLPAEREREFRGRGVHYCATCDGAMYQDKKLVVVGGGNSAVEGALFLTRYASYITIVHQLNYFQASQVAQDQLFKKTNIDVIWNSEVRKVEGDSTVKSIIIENVKTNETRAIATDAVFVYIGMEPRTGLFGDQLTLNQWGYINTDAELKTNIERVLAAGDVRSKSVRQIATAVGDGAMAGIAAEKIITEINQNTPGLH